MVRLSECSSYRGLALSSDFYEKVLVKVQRKFKNSSSYPGFEFSRMYCTFKDTCFYRTPSGPTLHL